MNDKIWERIRAAVEAVQSGAMKRVEVSDNIKVYACGTIIRIDIKSTIGET